ncbi:MAG: APC family permease [Actinomycetota bacterium]|nr:APC family permease [Actinomycetota bacterium]
MTSSEFSSLGIDTPSASREKKKLRVLVGRVDALAMIVCALIGFDTFGKLTSEGAQAITWLVFMGVVFFIPYGLLCAELGTAFPLEGGPYVWVKLAFGRFVAAMTALLYWISNPLWLGGTLTITAIAAFDSFFSPLGPLGRYVFALLFIWTAVAATVFTFSVGKYVVLAGAWARVVLIGFFTFTLLVYAARHGVHGVVVRDFSPSLNIFTATTPILFFALVGFELPSEAGEEMVDARRDVPVIVARGALGTMLMYGVPILAVLLILPTAQLTSLGGFLNAVKLIFTVYGGHATAAGSTLTGAGLLLGDFVAVGFIITLLSSGVSWIMGGNRGWAVAALDGAAPRSFGVISATYGTPVVVDLVAGVVATITMFLAYWLASGNAAKYFSVVLGLAISTSAMAYLAIFPALTKLRYSHADVARPFRIRGGRPVAWLVSMVTTLWALVATIGLLWPGVGSSPADASLPTGWAGQRWRFELTQALPLAVTLLVGVIWYAMGAATRREVNESEDYTAASRNAA